MTTGAAFFIGAALSAGLFWIGLCLVEGLTALAKAIERGLKRDLKEHP